MEDIIVLDINASNAPFKGHGPKRWIGINGGDGAP